MLDMLIKPLGYIVFISRDKDGKEVVLREVKNLALDAFYAHIVSCLREGTSIGSYIAKMSLGRGGHAEFNETIPIPPLPADTALQEEIDPPGKKTITARISATPYEVEFNVLFEDTECNGHISEAALWLDNDTLVNKATFPTFEKPSDKQLLVKWFIYYYVRV